jgi:hypothetical protein
MDNPFVYAVALIVALAVYVDSLNEGSLINSLLEKTSTELVEIGERGLFTTAKEAAHLESTLTKSIVLGLFIALKVYVVVCLWKWINSGGKEQP